VISIPTHTLNDGTTLPALGLGTWPLGDDEAQQAVLSALEAGYRLIDTATNYRNETGVGRAVASGMVPREEIVVTTKLPGRHHGYEETLASFEESRTRLALEYVDLYLIHWPLPRVDRYVDSWKAMVKLREEGLVRSIGVSNFTAGHIERLEKETGVLPSVNQIELHPFLPQEELTRPLPGRGPRRRRQAGRLGHLRLRPPPRHRPAQRRGERAARGPHRRTGPGRGPRPAHAEQ
jgi:diketogulonate reductase-like aldo/keto reductase